MEDIDFLQKVQEMNENELNKAITKMFNQYDMMTFVLTINALSETHKQMVISKIKVMLGINEDISLNDLFMIMKLSLKKDVFSIDFLKGIFVNSDGLNNIFETKMSQKQRTFILLELLENANYQYIEEKCSSDIAEKILRDFDIKIQGFTEILKEWRKAVKNPNIAITDASRMYNFEKILKRYSNFLNCYANCRVEKYISMSDRKTLEAIDWIVQNKLELTDGTFFIYDDAMLFDYFYPTDKLLKLIDSYERKDEKEDDYLVELVNLNDSKPFMIELVNANCPKTVEAILQNLIVRSFNKNSDRHPNDEQIILNYLQGILINENIDFSDRILDKIQTLVKQNILPEDFKEACEKIINEKINSITCPDMKEYEEYLSNNLDMPEDVADRFIQDIMKFGFVNKKIPIEYVEYVIKRLFDETSYYSTQLSDNIVQKIYLEFARYRAQITLKENTVVLINEELSSDTLGNSIYNGNGDSNLIELSEKISVLESINIIITVFHEIDHLKKSENRAKGEYDYFAYLIKKEGIIKSKDLLFYERNYRYMYEELCAEFYGLSMALNFVKSLFSEEDLKKAEIADAIKKCENELKIMIDLRSKAEYKIDKNGQKRLVSEMFDETIKEDLSIIEKNPIFKIEYNDDGSKKGLVEIFKEYLLVCRDREHKLLNFDLYRNILLSRTPTNEEIEQLQALTLPDDLSDITKKILNDLKNRILGKDESLVEAVTPEMIIQIEVIMSQRSTLNNQREME